jgi:hypothetical protein
VYNYMKIAFLKFRSIEYTMIVIISYLFDINRIYMIISMISSK